MIVMDYFDSIIVCATRDRALFNDVWAKMVNQLNQGKLNMMNLIEQSTAAYDQREELCNKLQLLKEKSDSDKVAHVQEMRELQRKLDHDAKLQHFLGVKGQHRVNTELEARENNKRLQQQEELENQLEEYNEIIEKIKVKSSTTCSPFPILGDDTCSLWRCSILIKQVPQ